MKLVSDLCERVILMKSGEIIADGKIKEVFTRESLLEKTKIELPEIAKLSKILGFGIIFDPKELYEKWRSLND